MCEELVKDRRFENLVECVLCELGCRRRDSDYDEADDVEDDEDEGLNELSASRAAWVLGVSEKKEEMGD